LEAILGLSEAMLGLFEAMLGLFEAILGLFEAIPGRSGAGLAVRRPFLTVQCDNRRMKRLLLAIALSALALPSLAVTPQQSAWLAKANRHEQDGWTYLHIEGTPRERGFQHRYLLAGEIADGIRMRRTAWEYDSGMEWPWLVERAAKMFVPKIDAELLAEIDGIAEGMQAAGKPTSRDELVAYNGYFDIGYWWPEEKKKVGSQSPNRPKQSCSSFIATGSMTADHGIVLGHNTMFEYPAATANVIVDLVPAKGHHILMQIFPGWIHSGTDFFITDAGLVGSETTIGGFFGFDEKAIPEFVRMRRATQDAGTIDEWAAIMKKGNNGGYANAWLIGDTKTNEIARLELGLKYVGFERTKDGFFVGSNVAENQKLLRFETSEREQDIRISSVARRVRWKELMRENAGKIDVDKAKAFEADHYDTYLGRENPGPRTLCGHFELNPGADNSGTPYDPAGTFDAKVVDTAMARRMSFAARWGSACGMPFDAKKFLADHPQFDWMRDILPSRPSEPWTVVSAR
jgi:hypothetical protein